MTTLRIATPSATSTATTSVAAPEADVLYQLVKRAEINPTEVEDLTRSAIEVTVLWNRSALHVAHLDDDRGFTLSSVAPSLPSPATRMLPALGVGGAVMLGGAVAASLAVASAGALATAVGVGLGVHRHHKNELLRQDGGRFVVDAEMLGADELPVVVREGAGARFVFAHGAAGEVEIDGEKRSLAELTAQGLARPSSVLAGAFEVAMVPGGKYRMDIHGLSVVAKAVRAGRRPLVAGTRDRALGAASIGAAMAVAALLGVMRFAAHDDVGMLSGQDQDDRLAELRDFLARHSEQPEPPAPREGAAAPNDRGGQDGAAHSGPAGAMGRPSSTQRNRAYSIQRTNEPPHLANRSSSEQVAARGIFAALDGAAAMRPAATSGIVNPFGQMTEAGDADATHAGNLAGDDVGDAFGMHGLDTVGPGWGGGGHNDQTVGTGRLNTLGHSNGCPEGQDCRYGATRGGHLGPAATHAPHPPRAGVPEVQGISPDVIRRVVLRNIGQVNHCYEQGLSTNASLAGRVAVRFVIGSGGNVIASTVANETLGVPSVSQCIANAVGRWSFPVPADSGAITVTYPFALFPAD